MKKLIGLLTLVFIFNCDGAPQIYFDTYKHNVGTINRQAKVTHVFQFRNTGSKNLIIDDVKPFCGCTAALLSKKNIAPGMTGKIEMTYSAGKTSGKFSKTVKVVSNDPQNNRIYLKLEGTIK